MWVVVWCRCRVSLCWFGISSLVVIEGVGVCRLVVKLFRLKLVLWFIVEIIGVLLVVIVWVSVLLLKVYRFFSELLSWVSRIML